MSINAFPITAALASKMIRAMVPDAPEGTKYEIVPIVTAQPGQDLCYIKEIHGDSGLITMHGKELGRAHHAAAAQEARRLSASRKAQEARLAARAAKPAPMLMGAFSPWCDCGECSICERIANAQHIEAMKAQPRLRD